MIESFDRRMLLRPYSLMGNERTQSCCCGRLLKASNPFQELATAIMSARMGDIDPSSVLPVANQAFHLSNPDNPAEDVERLIISPSEAKYLFVHPFSRRALVQNVSGTASGDDGRTYSGRAQIPSSKSEHNILVWLDDQEFVVAFETDEPSDFLDLVQELRETDTSLYMLRDNSLYSCIRMGLAET
jgi:chlorite dismutase